MSLSRKCSIPRDRSPPHDDTHVPPSHSPHACHPLPPEDCAILHCRFARAFFRSVASLHPGLPLSSLHKPSHSPRSRRRSRGRRPWQAIARSHATFHFADSTRQGNPLLENCLAPASPPAVSSSLLPPNSAQRVRPAPAQLAHQSARAGIRSQQILRIVSLVPQISAAYARMTRSLGQDYL